MNDCVFCKITAGNLPATIVQRASGFLAFHDIAPKAPIHLLVIPERHVASISEVDALTADERAAMGPFIAAVASAAELDATGYRVVTNCGADARQEVQHLHWHILGGALLSQSM